MSGGITVQSAVGQGSTFSFKIPFNTIDINAQQLKEMTAKNINEQNASAQDTQKILFSNARILVAEDHQLNQIFIVKLLKQYNCTNYKIVENGKLAVSEYKNNDYDAIFMDCHMPVLSGHNATERIRKIEQGTNKRIPIIAITADTMSGTKQSCLDSGMDDYISKPIDMEAFKSTLESWFSFAQNHEEESCEAKSRTPLKKINKIVNLDVLNEYTDGDEEQNKELLKVFYTKTTEDLHNLSKYITEGKSEDWSHYTHGLKGSAAYIGADKLYNLAERAQNLISGKQQEREKLFKEIQSAHQNICTYLSEQNLLDI